MRYEPLTLEPEDDEGEPEADPTAEEPRVRGTRAVDPARVRGRPPPSARLSADVIG